MRRCGLLVYAVSVVAIFAVDVSASTVTWEAIGKISSVYDPPLGGQELASIAVATPWTLDLTFDPDTPGVHAAFCDPHLPLRRRPECHRFSSGLHLYEHGWRSSRT
jgi:hypothetical protein